MRTRESFDTGWLFHRGEVNLEYNSDAAYFVVMGGTRGGLTDCYR